MNTGEKIIIRPVFTPTRYLAFKLLAGMFVIMLIGVAVLTFFLVKLQSGRLTGYSTAAALQTSDVIKRSLEYQMLLNRREDIHQTLSTIGSEPGIEGVRIYNKKGEVAFSARPEEIGTKVDVSSQACVACHRGGSFEATPPAPGNLTRIFTAPSNERVMGVITPIRNDARCSNAACHAHAPSQTVLGVLDVMTPLTETDKNLAELARMQYIGGIALILVVTLFTGLFLSRMVNRPVKKLTDGTQAVIEGRLDTAIEVETNDEIGLLTESFNHMTRELRRAHDELNRLNQTLEERIARKTDELKRAQANMVQMEKMVSLGTLAATVAHELNNPLEGILTYARLVRRRLMGEEPVDEAARQEMAEELSIIADETTRCGTIVKNLLLFSRKRVGDFREHDLRTTLEQTSRLMDHHLKMHNVRSSVHVEEPLPMIFCDAQQMSQLVLALEINAVEAMPGGGTLDVTLCPAASAGSGVTLAVHDTGIGIQTEDLPHIFEPFFTTKREGKGTGLGLAVVYGIIERHGGTIDVDSRVNEGTTFVITLPVKPPSMVSAAG